MLNGKYALLWGLATLFCIFIEAFFSMMEMALVSFNRVRLQYYLNQGQKRAIWIGVLLKNPSRLFTTILLGINIALEFGSECSRQLYEALGLSPDIAPFTQVILVIVLAELAPLFAARRYAENVAMLGIPVIYAASIIMTPLVWIFSMLAKGINKIFGSNSQSTELFISRDDLQRVLEEKDEGLLQKNEEEFNLVVSNIFNIRNQTAIQAMVPVQVVKMAPSQCTVGEINSFWRKTTYSHLPLFHRYRHQIIGLVSPKDLIRVADDLPARDYCQRPWFITEDTPLMQIVHEFRHNHQDVAVVLNAKGEATGIVTLDDILKEIFGKVETNAYIKSLSKMTPVVERTLPVEMLVEDFNKQFEAHIPTKQAETLLQLALLHLGPHPEKGATFRTERYEWTIASVSLLGDIKTLSVKTLY